MIIWRFTTDGTNVYNSRSWWTASSLYSNMYSGGTSWNILKTLPPVQKYHRFYFFLSHLFVFRRTSMHDRICTFFVRQLYRKIVSFCLTSGWRSSSLTSSFQGLRQDWVDCPGWLSPFTKENVGAESVYCFAHVNWESPPLPSPPSPTSPR